jgi:hypothetical protein
MGVNYRATITVQNPNSASVTPPGRMADSARILVTWPAAADPGVSSMPTHFSGFYETFISLDRN